MPPGFVTTYGLLARAIGRPRAARAVGRALAKNPWLPEVPCHRVVLADGRLGGYVGGSRRKAKLLSQEGWQLKNGRLLDFEQKIYYF